MYVANLPRSTVSIDNRSSIFSNRTIAPLNITSALLEQVFTQYNIPHDFSDVVASFGQEPNIAEGSSNNATLNVNEAGDSTLSYQIRYVEQNGRVMQNTWSRRHTGIYHSHRANAGLDVVILLHPNRNPVFEDVISALQQNPIKRKQVCNDPLMLHEALLASYTDNWRWYMRYLGEQISRANDLAMVTSPERTEPNSSFVRVQELRNTNDLVLLARACCAGNLNLVERLIRFSHDSKGSVNVLEAYRAKLDGFIVSADALRGRAQNLIDLVSFVMHL